MALTPVMIERFPGLDLLQDPGDSRGALVASNVDLDDGTVRTRDGFSRYFTGTANEIVRFLHNRSDYSLTAAGHYIAGLTNGANSKFTAGTNVTRTSITHANLASPSRATAATIGTPTATYTYVTDTAGGGPIRRWDGTTWTSPAGMPANTTLLSYTSDSRLVACDTIAKVSFSDAGAPETFGANNYVNLTPGDGALITGVGVFDNKLFVFKTDKFFVFYGNTIDGAGQPIFNYRTVDTGVGLNYMGPGISGVYPGGGITSGPDALYFAGGDGIYQTTGGPPERISRPIDPFFKGVATSRVGPYWPYGVLNYVQDMAIFRDKLYVQHTYNIPGSGTLHFGMLVYDLATRTWSAWPDYIPTGNTAGGLMVWNGVLIFGQNVDLLFPDSGVTTDTINGSATAFTSTYRLPFETYGSPNRKRIREVIIEGWGTPGVQWARDWGTPDALGGTVTLGTAPTPATGRLRRAVRGRAFSLQFSSTGAWQINRAQLNVDEVVTGIATTAA